MSRNLEQLRLISCISQDDLSELTSLLADAGYRVFIIDGANVRDQKSFFRNSAKVLPQDPAIGATPNWDSWTDSIWGGLDALGVGRVAFVWTNVELMLEGGLPGLLIAVECFTDLIASVSNPETRISQTVLLRIFLVGNGPNFPRLEA